MTWKGPILNYLKGEERMRTSSKKDARQTLRRGNKRGLIKWYGFNGLAGVQSELP